MKPLLLFTDCLTRISTGWVREEGAHEYIKPGQPMAKSLYVRAHKCLPVGLACAAGPITDRLQSQRVPPEIVEISLVPR